MKKMIITQKQLQAINETFTAPTVLYANDATTPGVTAAVKSANNTGNTFSVKTPGTGGTVSATLPELENGIDLNNASKVDVVKDPSKTEMTESRYTKRQVELGRMLEMRKRGKVYSKKQLNEMFMETQENADRLRDGIGQCDIFQVIDAVDEFFPEESEGFKEALHNGADLAEYLCSVFSRGDINSDEEEEFLNALGI